jgi:hypothetical protein
MSSAKVRPPDILINDMACGLTNRDKNSLPISIGSIEHDSKVQPDLIEFGLLLSLYSTMYFRIGVVENFSR